MNQHLKSANMLQNVLKQNTTSAAYQSESGEEEDEEEEENNNNEEEYKLVINTEPEAKDDDDNNVATSTIGGIAAQVSAEQQQQQQQRRHTQDEDEANDIEQQINKSQNESALKHASLSGERDSEQMGAAGALASIGLLLENRGLIAQWVLDLYPMFSFY